MYACVAENIDNLINQKVCVKMLSHLGYNLSSHVYVVADGAAAVHIINQNNKSTTNTQTHTATAATATAAAAAAADTSISTCMFDVVLMDVFMPVMVCTRP